jgi:hypothetical protein
MDEVPGRAELAQYQRRFLELYTQGILSVELNRLFDSMFLSEMSLRSLKIAVYKISSFC